MTDPQYDLISALVGELDLEEGDVEDILSDDFGYDVLWPEERHKVSFDDASELILQLKLMKHDGKEK